MASSKSSLTNYYHREDYCHRPVTEPAGVHLNYQLLLT